MTQMTWKQLQPILARKGLLSDKGRSRYATARRCPNCRATILTGIDWEQERFIPCREIAADINPISAAGEMVALALGRATYDLKRDHTKGRWRLHSRTHYGPPHAPGNPYRLNPIGTPRQTADVHAEHACGSTLPQVPPRALYALSTDYTAPPPY